MKKFLIAVYGCLLLLLAATTFVEQTYSTDFVEKHVYHTIWFCCLWGALAAMTVVVLVRQRLWRRLPTLLLHGSFLVILAGAMTTFLCGRKGYVHLTVGSEVNCFLEQDGRQVVELPFTLRLDSFRIEYYPGTDAPADYISYIHGETPVSMNRILSRQGFRFYQSSFDEDMQGSWLTVNYDPWGIGITYSGYLLLGVSMLWMLVSRGGEFRRLLRHPLLKKGGMFVLLLLCLDSFRIEYYPGTDAPADYISYIHGETPVSMNRILSRQGFRFYQSSFDEDMQGSWLTVNYDPWGIGITYSGYLLLGVSMLWMLVSRGGEFRRLLRHPLLKKGGMFVLLLLCLGSGVHAQKRSLPALARKQADSLARKQVIYNDRVVPFNTLARDFVLKLTGKPSYGGMTPEQVIGGWLLRPEVWQNEPMIYIKNEALRRLLHLETPYACLADLFDGEKYRLQKFWKGKQDHHQKMTSLEKAIVEADEKVGLILMLQNGTLIRPLPEDGSVEPVSDTKIQAELLYNRIPFSKLLFMFNLTVGMLAFFRLLYRGLRRSSALSDSSGRIVALSFSSRLADTFFPFSLYAAFLFQLFGYGLRWYIGGRIPLGNGYETMQFMALCALFLACLFRRRFPFMVPFGFLLSGFALLVSYLGQMNPQITPLMPVLVSPWLSTHVSLIMMSYALFAFMMLNGILALCLRRSARMLMLLSRLLLYPAVFFLGAGIFLGAVWANASWGRYWAWDPKEVWALITFMVYGAAFHARSLRIFRSPLFFHIYMVAAFLTVLMTYFGVNYILGGMHSYANA